MTDRDSHVRSRTGGTNAMRLWAQGVRAALAGSRELVRAGDETVQVATAPYARPRTERSVADVAPRGAVSLGPRAPAAEVPDDPFDAFLARFEPELPTEPHVR